MAVTSSGLTTVTVYNVKTRQVVRQACSLALHSVVHHFACCASLHSVVHHFACCARLACKLEPAEQSGAAADTACKKQGIRQSLVPAV